MRLQQSYSIDELVKIKSEEIRYILENHFAYDTRQMDEDEMYSAFEEELEARNMIR